MNKHPSRMPQSSLELSRTVLSNQSGPHPRLARTVSRHLHSEFKRPVATHSERAYAELAASLQRDPRPLILDSFCGTGQSTRMLAQQHPQALVAGIDQSAHRLSRHQADHDGNYLLLHASAEDIWQLLWRDGYRVQHHYLLYPNPWPKGKHLQRRVHGHASFALLLRLGGAVELRSNWQLYAEEFGVAMHLAGRRGYLTRITGEPPLTLFEEKYRRSGHQLWCYRAGPAVTKPDE